MSIPSLDDALKRLYLIGTSQDDKRLIFARTKGAKFGSFSLPISSKLVKIVRELDSGRGGAVSAAKGGGPAAEERGATADAAPAEGGPGEFREMTGLSSRSTRAAQPTPMPAGQRGAVTARPAAEPEKAEPSSQPLQPERKRPKRKPFTSKLSPAQIQALLRKGKSARSVATEASAPIDWVRRLMEPILLERMGIVEEMKRVRYAKPRLGPSETPIGTAIVENLRDRGVAFPERASMRGWTAHRPDGREWRVRFTFEHRGAARTAQWEYDPPTRTAVPLNPLAVQLSWRPSDNSHVTGGEGRDGNAQPAPTSTTARKRPARKPASRASTAKRSTAKKRTVKKSSAKKRTAKKSTAKKSTAKKPAAKKSSAKKRTTKKPAAKKSATVRRRSR